MKVVQCERCGEWHDRADITAFPVNKKKGGRTSLDLCQSCTEIWNETQPSEWVKIGDILYQRIYWACEFCRDIYQHQELLVVIRTNQGTVPRTKYIVCKECLKKVQAQGDISWSKING